MPSYTGSLELGGITSLSMQHLSKEILFDDSNCPALLDQSGHTTQEKKSDTTNNFK